MSAIALRPTATRSPLWIVIWAVPIAALLAVLPWVLEPYRTIQMAYGLIFAIAGLGFNILLGYTGLLSFIVVVVGGLGSLEGALVGAVIVGLLRETAISLFPELELAVLYLIAALVLLVRPAGLFGRAT